MLLRTFLGAAAVLGYASATTPALSAEDMFRGKEISVLIGAGPGGGADAYARVFVRHYGRYLPDNPSIVAKNVPGAGGLKLANQIYNVASKDGTEIAMFPAAAALEPLFGGKAAKYDTLKFTWIGNMDSEATGCATWKHTGIKTWQDLKNRETTFGASGTSSASSVHVKVIGVLLGVKTKVIHGFQGTRTSNLAMQRGELDGTCALYMSTFRSQFMSQVKSGDLTVWMTFGKQRTKEFPNAPTIFEVVKNEDDRKLAELIFGQNAIGRPLTAPPGLSAERAVALRTGFMATMGDKAFLDEATKLGLSIQAMSGEETQKAFESFYSLPTAVVSRAKAIIGRD